MMVQIADAQAFLRSKGCAHCDLKPENILSSNDKIPRLADYNAARALVSVIRSGLSWTPGYAAPEQLGGEMPFENLDFWAFGLVLYEASRGELLLPQDELRYQEAVNTLM
ncbi:protein kinase domain-containing protein [Infirmifilum uzonense]|uniref:protein kinase domain-containing protein n=1 Tax=Infirmifilum uzonense TaxID=1550241 RepID=UPI003C739070